MSSVTSSSDNSSKRGSINIVVQNGNNSTVDKGGNIINSNPVHIEIGAPVRNIIEKRLGPHYVSAAVLDAQPGAGCTEGTRVKVLDNVMCKVLDRFGPPVIWISGMAGTGKTCIALTLCQKLRKEPTILLGGTFFCSRIVDAPARAAVENIIPTLAVLLARAAPECGERLVAELKSYSDVAKMTIPVQGENLFVKPLEAWDHRDRQIVFVIDALDECRDKDQLVQLLEAMATFASRAGPVRFIVTARPDPRIRVVRMENIALCSQIELYALDQKEVAADIRLVLHETFKKAPNRTFYTDDDLDALTERAGGLFIFASVAAEYICETNSPDRLNIVKKKAFIDHLAAKRLEKMYEVVLEEAFGPVRSGPHELDGPCKIISAILASRESLSVSTLTKLLDVSKDQVQGALDRLHAVMFIPKHGEEGAPHFLHTTFVDFVAARAKLQSIQINELSGHIVLAKACLRLFTKDLHFDMSQNLSPRDDCWPTKGVKVSRWLYYACQHWVYHAYGERTLTTGISDDLINLALRSTFLFWLEVFSILKRVDLVLKQLNHATARTPKVTDLADFLRDALSFVEDSREAIEFKPTHIYISALPFTSKESLVAKTFSGHLSNPSSVQTFGIAHRGSRRVVVAAVSPDGRFVASALNDGTLRIWDAEKRKEIGHKYLKCGADVRALAISSGGKSVATGEGCAVRVCQPEAVSSWAQPSGKQNGNIHARIQTVAFSPDGARLISGSSDGTISVWEVNSETRWYRAAHMWIVRLLLSLRWSLPSNVSVSSVAYSPSTKQGVAAGYASGIVQTLHAMTGGPLRAPFKVSPDPPTDISSLVFAPDGSFILAACGNAVFRCVSGSKPSLFLSGHTKTVRAVACSSDGEFIVSGADDATVRLWNAWTGQVRGSVFRGHYGPVLAVGVLPDNRSVVSAGSDGTVRLWNVVARTGAQDGQDAPLEIPYIQDGWLCNPSSPTERLLWVPPKYRDKGDNEGEGRSKIIDAHWDHAVLGSNADHMRYDDNWSNFWKVKGGL